MPSEAEVGDSAKATCCILFYSESIMQSCETYVFWIGRHRCTCVTCVTRTLLSALRAHQKLHIGYRHMGNCASETIENCAGDSNVCATSS